jgi:membrane protein required for colicin V production
MAELGLTAWDWFVLATVVLSIGLGFIRGLVRTIFALAAWVVSLLGVPVAMHWLVPVLPPELPYALLVVVIFLALFIGVRMLGALAFRALRGIGLGGADRLLGGALGAVRAAVIILLVALAAQLGGYSKRPDWQQAHCRPLLEWLVQSAEPFLPERLSGVQRT